MNNRLVEIERQEQEYLRIAADAIEKARQLANKRIAIMTKTVNKKENPLEFDGNIVRWDGGEVKLTDTALDILTALWFADKHRLKTITLCSKVWGDGCVKQKTLDTALYRLRGILKEYSFPYKIAAIKGRKNNSVKGYAIR